jgi:hypothetical protein
MSNILSSMRGVIYAASLTRPKAWSGFGTCLQYNHLVSRRKLQHETLSLLFLVFRVVVGTLHCTLDIDRLVSAYEDDGVLSD